MATWATGHQGEAEPVFTAVGAYTGLAVDRDALKAGDLHGVLVAPA
ncbi:hypothetical protein ACG5V6_10360 [Streptomyces chitinivorans]|uniref:Uncharacterized protein n=1 Tax=Streptomyces chitinivorans TaxID=1257027 RepID=A0ABW7HS22_9ACTN|nr:hypothetical protein [Streptomyces chitinivorans]MDH2411676.1 hypothetical protein [Streptomyces chitinivorans]